FEAQILGKRIDWHHARPGPGAAAVERLHARIGHLPVIAIPLRLAAVRQPLAVAKAPRHPRLIEPNAFQTGFAVIAENDAADGAAIVEPPAVNLHDFALHGLRLARPERGNPLNVGQVLVSAGKVEE